MYSAASQQQQQQQQPSTATRQDSARNASGASNSNHNYQTHATTAPRHEKQPSGFNDAQYPSLAASQQQQMYSSAPAFDGNGMPIAQALPVYYNTNNNRTDHVQQQPYPQQQYSYASQSSAPLYPQLPPMQTQQRPPQQQGYLSPARSGDYRRHGYIGTTLKLMIFHALNALLGITAFVLVFVGTNIAIGLLPLCCIGLAIFRVVLFAVAKLAKLDVKLYNYISPTSEHVYVDIPQNDARFFGYIAGERLSPQLTAFSPLAITAGLYFCTIKFAVGILSCIVVSIAGALLAALGAVVSGTNFMDNDGTNQSPAFMFGDRRVSASENAAEFALVWVCVLVISIALMHVVARISRASTRFFCCEKFSTYRYICGAQQEHAQLPVSITYGSY